MTRRRLIAASLVAVALYACTGNQPDHRWTMLNADGRPERASLDELRLLRLVVERELHERAPSLDLTVASDRVVVATRLEPTAQASVARSLAIVPGTRGRFEPATLVVDTRTAEVVGLHTIAVGDTEALATPRSSGSTLKLVVLLAAARAGIGPDAVLDGKASCRFPTPTGTYDAAAGATTLASGTLRQMTAASVNCAFAQLAVHVGPEALATAAADLGIAPLSDLGPRFAVGANSVTPTELLTALITLLGDGIVRVPHVVVSVERDGEPIPLASPARPTPTVTAEERSAVLPSLVAVLTSGIAHESQLSGGRPAAGKTGTQPNNTDA